MTDEMLNTTQPPVPVLAGDVLDAARDLVADLLPLLIRDVAARYDPHDSPQLLLFDLRRACHVLDCFTWPEDADHGESLEVELVDPDDRDLVRRAAFVALARGPGYHVEAEAVLRALGRREYELVDDD